MADTDSTDVLDTPAATPAGASPDPQQPGETLAQRMARVAKQRGISVQGAAPAPTAETLEQRMARVSRERGIGAPSAPAVAPTAPTPVPITEPALQMRPVAWSNTPGPTNEAAEAATLAAAPKLNAVDAGNARWREIAGPDMTEHLVNIAGDKTRNPVVRGAAVAGSVVTGAIEHPIDTYNRILMAAPEAMKTLAQGSAELDARNALSAAGQDPESVKLTSTPAQIAGAAAQLATMALAGPLEDKVREQLAAGIEAIESARGLGNIAGADRGAAIIARTIATALPGAAFMPDHPLVGAIGGGVLGALHATVTGARANVGDSPLSINRVLGKLSGSPTEPFSNLPEPPESPASGGGDQPQQVVMGSGGGGGAPTSGAPGGHTLPTTSSSPGTSTAPAPATPKAPSLLDAVIKKTGAAPSPLLQSIIDETEATAPATESMKAKVARAVRAFKTASQQPAQAATTRANAPAPTVPPAVAATPQAAPSAPVAATPAASTPASAPAPSTPASSAPVSNPAAPDLSSPEVAKIVQKHDLQDLVRQRGTLLNAQGQPSDPETAARGVIDQYRQMIHTGVDPEAANAAIADEHVKQSEDPSLPWKSGTPPGARAVETLQQRMDRVADETETKNAAAAKANADTQPHEHSSTQLNLPESTAKRGIAALAAKIPDADLAPDGRETTPHITVKYGLHTNDADDIRKLLANQPPIPVTLGKTSLFKNDDADVVKVDVDSPELHALNKKIADALPHTDTHPDYKPHVTVAYVKPGSGEKYAGDSSVQGHTITLDHLTFSGKDGKSIDIPLTGKTTNPALAVTPETGGVGHVMQFSNGRWGFAGQVHPHLAFVQKSGHAPTQEQLDAAKQAGPGFAGLRPRTFDTQEAALEAAKQFPTQKVAGVNDGATPPAVETPGSTSPAHERLQLRNAARAAEKEAETQRTNDAEFNRRQIEAAAQRTAYEDAKQTGDADAIEAARQKVVRAHALVVSTAKEQGRAYTPPAFWKEFETGASAPENHEDEDDDDAAYAAEKAMGRGLTDEEELERAVERGEMSQDEADLKNAFRRYSEWRSTFTPRVKGDDVETFDEWLVNEYGYADAKKMLGRAPVDRAFDAAVREDDEAFGKITPDVKALLHAESESLESEGMAAPGPTEQDEADRQPPPTPGKLRLVGKKAKPTSIEKEAKHPSIDTLARYFAPGRIVNSYAGKDRVLKFERSARSPGWVVTVQAVHRQGDEWVVPPGERIRMHVTQPSEKELRAFLTSEAAEKPAASTPATDASSKSSASSGPSTPYDTPTIVAARQHSTETAPTRSIDTPEREALRNRLAGEQFDNAIAALGEDPQYEQQLIVAIGLPASGKTSLMSKPASEHYGAPIFDTDAAKKLIQPEYDHGKGSQVVYKEAGYINEIARDRARRDGMNFVYPTIGANPEALREYLEEMVAEGYSIHLRYVHVPVEVAVPRAVTRYDESVKTGGEEHFVDPAYILQLGDVARQTYEALKSLPGVKSYAEIDNTAEGHQPRLVDAHDAPDVHGYTSEHPVVREPGEQPAGRGGTGGTGRLRRPNPSGSSAPAAGATGAAAPATGAGGVDESVLRGTVPESARGAAPAGVREPTRKLRAAGGGERTRGESAGAVRDAARADVEGQPGAGDVRATGAAVLDAGGARAGDRDRGSDAEAGSGGADRGTSGRADDGARDLAQQHGANYALTPDAAAALTARGGVAKAKRNIAALELLKKIEAEQRPATRDEQVTLSGYTGWGALPYLFDPDHKQYAPLGPQLRALLTDAEWESARATTPNAHYTSPEVIDGVHALVNRLGFTGGRILEPSMGAGYFLGLTPPAHRRDYKWTGVELDDLTGRIGKLLYPDSDIRVQGFQDLDLPDGFFDVAIGNVPFGNYKVADPRYNKLGLSIHNYFFRKTLDLVRPGGLVAFITSPFTMDAKSTAVRAELAKHADLVAAIRLPSSAFKGIASTDVTTDLIILRTRAPGTDAGGEAWTATQPHTVPGKDGPTSIALNEYFVAHPENILGELRGDGTMNAKFGGESEMTVRGTGDLGEQLRAAIARMPANVYQPAAISSPASRTPESMPELAPEGLKDRGLLVDGATIKQRRNGVLVDAKVPKSAVERVTKLIALRDLAIATLTAQLEDASDERVDSTREALDKAYTAFVKQYGPIRKEVRIESSRTDKAGNPIVQVRQPNLQHFDDADAALVATLEHYDPDTNTAKKADILERRVFEPRKLIEHADSPMDALPMVLAEMGHVDLDRIAALSGVTPADARAALRGQIFEDPAEPGRFMTLDEYTAGDVKTKLEEARAAAATDPHTWADNIAALEPAIPADLLPSQIDAMLGARWIPTSDYEQFVRDVLSAGDGTVKVTYTAAANIGYKVQADWRIESSVPATTDFGTKRMNGVDLFQKALNLQSPTIYGGTEEIDGRPVTFEDEEGKPAKNPIATVAAQEKQELLKERFEKWVWEDDARAQRLAAKYNREHNRVRLATPDGSFLTLPGAASYVKGTPFKMRVHQLNAVWRIIVYGNTLLAHEVGTGKTYTMIAAGMELKRLGLAKKPMHVVLKHMIDQYAVEMKQLYPSANVLIATDEDFAMANRHEFVARAAQNNWDAIIIGHSSFEKIPMSRDFQERYIGQQLAELESAIREAKAAKGDRATIKQIEKAKFNLEAKLEQMAAGEKKDDLLTFEQLGVDMLFVDEADSFKNLHFTTKMEGISAPNAQKSFDMLMKATYLEQINPGRGLVFATGTPIANAVAEVYTMMRYLQPKALAAAGLANFDDWAAMFGKSVVGVEMKPDSTGFRVKSRFAQFRNVGELAQLFRQTMDVQFAEDLPDIKRPAVKGGGMQMVETPITSELKAYVKTLGERSDRIRSGKVAPEEDNMLKITSDGRKAALDMRLVDPDAIDDPDNKVNRAVANIFDVWERTKEIKGAQLVFADIYQTGPKGTGVPGFNVYEDVREKLAALGVPKAEIRFASDAKNDAQKAKLKADVRAGRVRVLIGSTEKMGAGMNVQDRLVALHHLDAPHRPRDVEQRNGRIIRQGNLLYEAGKIPHVEVYAYLAGGSYDGYMWQGLERKAGFIQTALKADAGTRSIEDIDDVVIDWATAKAIASGNPKVKEKADVDAAVAKLERSEKSFRDERFAVRKELAELPGKIEGTERELRANEADAKRVVPTAGDAFTVTIHGATVTERPVAGEMLKAAIQKEEQAALKLANGESHDVKIGTFAGFDLYTASYRSQLTEIRDIYLLLRGDGNHFRDVAVDPSGASLVAGLEAMPKKIAGVAESLEAKRTSLIKRQTALTAKGAGETFPKAAELATLKERQTALNTELQKAAEETPEAPPGDSGAPDVPPPTDAFGFVDPFSAAFAMWKQANALRRARLAQTAAAAAAAGPGTHPMPDPSGLGYDRNGIRPSEFIPAAKALLNPESLDLTSKGAAGTIRHQTAVSYQKLAITNEALREFGHAVDRLPRTLQVKYWDDAENGRSTGDLEVDAGNKLLHQLTQQYTDELIARGRLQAESAITDYIGRFWSKPNGAKGVAFLRSILGKRPLQGPKSFLKGRSLEHFVDGLDAGLTPATYNWVDSQLAKIAEMQRLIAADDMLAAEKKAGRAKRVMNGQQIPLDDNGKPWQRIGQHDDPAFVIYGPRTGAVVLPEDADVDPSDVRVLGRRIMGFWYAPASAVAVWNAHLSKGLRGNPWIDAYMAPAQAAAQILLAFSGFHGTVIATEGIFSEIALAIDELANGGSRLKAMRHLARTPGAPVTLARLGKRVVEEYKAPGTHPELARVLDAMIKGGYRATDKSEFWTGERKEKFRRAFNDAMHAESKGRRLWGAARLPVDAIFTAIELASSPLLAKYVPYMKTGATYSKVAQELGKLPQGATLDQVHAVMSSVTKEMDYRFGQVVYDNHFINSVAKHLAQMVFLAPGWTFGTIALASRGVGDVVRPIARGGRRLRAAGGGAGAGAGAGGKGGGTGPTPPSSKAPPEIPPELIGKSAAYWIGAALGTMFINGLLTYLHTGDVPEGKDYFAYRDGSKDRDGNWNRHTIPGYIMHDIYGWSHHPVDTFRNKLSPVIAFMERVSNNRTYFGDEIIDPDASRATKLKQIASEARKELATPLSVQNFLESAQRGETGLGEMARNAVGITPAKREFVRTAAQNKMADYLALQGHDARTPEQVEVASVRHDIDAGVRDGEIPRDSVRRLRIAGELTPRQATSETIVAQQTARLERATAAGDSARAARAESALSPLLAKFKMLTPAQAQVVYDLGEPWEKALWQKAMKIDTRKLKHPNARTP